MLGLIFGVPCQLLDVDVRVSEASFHQLPRVLH